MADTTQVEALTQEKVFCNPKIYQPMPLTKLQAILEEFPWISRYVSPLYLSRIYVSRITPEIFTYQCGQWGHCSSAFEKILLLDGESELAIFRSEVVRSHRRLWVGPRRVVRKRSIFTGKVAWRSSVHETLRLLGPAASRVRFILSYFVPNQTAIIYKSPRDFTIEQWVQALINKERKEVQAEVKLIDGEALNVTLKTQ